MRCRTREFCNGKERGGVGGCEAGPFRGLASQGSRGSRRERWTGTVYSVVDGRWNRECVRWGWGK